MASASGTVASNALRPNRAAAICRLWVTDCYIGLVPEAVRARAPGHDRTDRRFDRADMECQRFERTAADLRCVNRPRAIDFR